ncbi:MAG: nickel-dependent hydrogenase large subunit [Planctomycetota bacterium]
MHFYHLHALDWVNPACNALKADPKATSAAKCGSAPPEVLAGLLPRHPDLDPQVRGERLIGPVQERLLEQPGVLACLERPDERSRTIWKPSTSRRRS